MLAEFRKSINSILYERVSSPFYGALTISWLIWNWKIWYVTLFVDSKELPVNKFTYIAENFADPNFLVWLPIASTIVLITAMPFISNGAFWLDLKFKTWRVNQKNAIEGKQLLTLEQSIKIRSEIREQEENFDKLLEKKNSEISLLQKEIEELRNSKKEPQPKEGSTKGRAKNVAPSNIGSSFSVSDVRSIKENKRLSPIYMEVIKHIIDKKEFPKLDEDLKDYLLINEFVLQDSDGMGYPYYAPTYKGREVYKVFFNEKFGK